MRWPSRKEDGRLFDPAAAREPLDPRPSVKMDDPGEGVREASAGVRRGDTAIRYRQLLFWPRSARCLLKKLMERTSLNYSSLTSSYTVISGGAPMRMGTPMVPMPRFT